MTLQRIELNDVFQRAWQGQDPFDAVVALQGEVFRAVKSRRTLRFELNGRSYFAKIHWGVGWREILKNLLQGKVPVVGAENEYQAIRHLEAHGVDTMTCAAFGLRGANPAQRKSFIVTEALTGTQSLETVCRAWSTTPPAPRLKHALIRQLARMCRIMHNSGMNHRDCYLCHFLLDVDSVQGGASERPRVYVIDLHRAQIRTRLPQRWREKDLAGLAFSALDLGLTRTDCMRFIREYEQEPLATVFRDRGKRWRNVRSKALSLYQKEFGRPARTQIR